MFRVQGLGFGDFTGVLVPDWGYGVQSSYVSCKSFRLQEFCTILTIVARMALVKENGSLDHRGHQHTPDVVSQRRYKNPHSQSDQLGSSFKESKLSYRKNQTVVIYYKYRSTEVKSQ